MLANSSWTQTALAEKARISQGRISEFLKAPPDKIPMLIGKQKNAIQVLEGLVEEWGRDRGDVREMPAPYNPDTDDPFVGIAMELRALATFLEDETRAPSRKFNRFEEDIRVHLKHLDVVRRLMTELGVQPSANH